MKHFADAQGKYLGAFVGRNDDPDAIEAPRDGIEVPCPPDGRCVWNGKAWGPAPPRAQERHPLAEIDALRLRLAALEARRP